MTKPKKRISWGMIAAVAIVGVIIAIASSGGGKPSDLPLEPSKCDGREAERKAWIDARSPQIEGYTPSVFGLRATGSCADVLRVHEDDCNVGHLLEAYGSKPFMQTAKALGFRRLSCGYDEYDLTVVVR